MSIPKNIRVALLLVIAAVAGLPLAAQTVKVTYWKEVMPAQTVRYAGGAATEEAAQPAMLSLRKVFASKRDQFVLLHSAGKSHFAYDTTLFLEPLEIPYRQERGDVDHYRDFSAGHHYRIVSALEGEVVREALEPGSAWKLEEEVQRIGLYDCRKATRETGAGQVVTAWYTEAVPIPDGPMGHYGLPGLIVQVEAEHYRMTLTEMVILPNEVTDITMPQADNYLTDAEMWDRLRPVIRRRTTTENR